MLEVNNLTMQFGALKSINDLSIKVNQGEVVSVIGPNGAGKTTLFNVITGIYTPTSGSVMLGEKKLNGLSPAKVNQIGIARTFQNVRLFLNMSVIENVMAATYAKTKSGLFALHSFCFALMRLLTFICKPTPIRDCSGSCNGSKSSFTR